MKKFTRKRRQKRLPLTEKLETLSFSLFGGLAARFLKHVYGFKDKLDRARIRIYPQTYVAMMLLFAVLTIPVSIVAAVLMLLFGFLPIIFLVPLPLYVIAGFWLMPLSKASDRSAALEREMPFAATYISVMASGGIAPYTSFKRMSEVELMPAMKAEARDIIKDVEIFGVDPLTALSTSARKNPLDIYRDFISGYSSTVIIGGDIGHFLERKAEDIFKTRALRVKAAAERLGMLLETFIIVMVMMSLCFYILFSVDAIYSVGVSLYSGIIMYTYVFTPLLSMMFIYLAHSMQPKSPSTDMRPYKIFGMCGAIAAVVFLVITNFLGLIPIFGGGMEALIDLPTASAIALVIATAPASFVQIKLAKEKSGLEKGINSFLRDLTEVRKTGLSPEKCIENLAERDYGVFSKELRKISSEISWGIPMKKVILSFLKRTKSWMTQIVMFLLVETIDVGGGTIPMIESLARFNNLTQEVEKEKRMQVRPYVFMPYLASILLVATTIMMMSFTTGTLTMDIPGMAASTRDFSMMKTIMLTSIITHSYLIGVVAGKISEESVAAGFKHATILVIIALLAAKIMPMFVAF
jgi:flagellar protein FlaJ